MNAILTHHDDYIRMLLSIRDNEIFFLHGNDYFGD